MLGPIENHISGLSELVMHFYLSVWAYNIGFFPLDLH